MVYLVTTENRLVDTPYKIISVEESLKLLSTLSIVGLDTETSGLDCHNDTLLSLQLGCYDFQIVIDCTKINILLYKDYLESNREFLFWNAKFDLKWLYKYKIVPKKVYDGYLAEKLMYLGYPSGYHSMSLKSAGEHYLGIELDKTIRGQIIWKGLTDDVIIYAAKDVQYLEKIKNAQHKELSKKELLTAIEYENKFVLALAYEEFCGVRLDQEKWLNKMKSDKEALDDAEASLNNFIINLAETDNNFKKFTFINTQGDLFEGFDLTPKCTINWNSAKQVIEVFTLLGFNLLSKDKQTGQMKPSVDAKIIKPQKDLSPIAPIYLKYKAAQKVVSTYGQNVLDQIDKKTGRLYTQFNQLGADTTRITSGGKDGKKEYINFLNMPSDEITRSCFVAELNNNWISIDYVGQETYLMASIANDTAILKELNEGSGDIHSLTAYMTYKEIPRDTPIKDIKKKYHNLRQEAKSVEFAINYGGNADTISRNKGIPIEEANKIYNEYMLGFKGLKKYQDFRRKDWFDKGYILLSPLTGHKAFIYDYEDLKATLDSFKEPGFWSYYREMKQVAPTCDTIQKVKHFFKRKSENERCSINFPIQAAGSFCLRVSMINFFEWLRKENLLFKVLICITPYDEFDVEAPKGIAEKVALKLKDFMVKAGKYFCDKCKLDADISYDKEGNLPTYWIH